MSELYQEIARASKNETTVSEKANETIWLVFKVGENHYAIDSVLVQEVMRNTECYPLPFVPKYVAGVLNSYGTPCAVINLDAFLNNNAETSTGSQFYLVLKNKNSLSFQVTDIQEFHNQSEVQFDEFQNGEDSKFFMGTVSFDGVVAPVLDTEAIIEKVRSDIEAR